MGVRGGRAASATKVSMLMDTKKGMARTSTLAALSTKASSSKMHSQAMVYRLILKETLTRVAGTKIRNMAKASISRRRQASV